MSVPVQALHIAGFRGIKNAVLEGFSELTVLVGPNSSGKSTVLEALLLTCTKRPDVALRTVLRHRVFQTDPGRWLFWSGPDEGKLEISRSTSEGKSEGVQISTIKTPPALNLTYGPALHAALLLDPPEYKGSPDGSESANGIYVRFVTPSGLTEQLSLERAWSDVVRAGRRDEVFAILKKIIPAFERLELLATATSSKAELHFTMQDRLPAALPIRLLGDGAQSLIREALQVASRPDGIVLLEEPEAFKHPAALRQTARVLASAVSHGAQVILSTHSLELVDDLVHEMEAAGALEKLTVMRFRLDDGVLSTSRFPGDLVRASRVDLEEDLR